MDENIFEQLLSGLIDPLFDQLILQQQDKTLRIARERIPSITGDDILNPHDFPELMQDPIFNYEEGMAAGLMAAHIAIRARLREAQRLEAKKK